MARPWKNCCREVAPFCALVTVQFTEVGVNILFKEATMKGLSYYVFILYSFALSTLILLLPLPFIFRRSTGLPSLNLCILCKISSLGLLGFLAQLCGYKGIDFSSPTLASAMANLLPAFTFVLAVFFRMEKADLRSSSTQAKIMGSIASIAGALIVVLYKGPTILNASSPSQAPPLNSALASSQRNWVLGGFLLAVAYILMSIWYIVLTHIIKLYPAELIVTFLCNLCGTIIAVPVCFLAEENLRNWKLKPDITVAAILYSAFFSIFFSTIVHTWGLHLKGPVYVSMFKPLSIAIAAAMSVIFLGEALYLGSVVGSVILCIGFYAVIWGKAKEEELHEDENYCFSNSGSQLNSKVPLLHS
ncbi:WAT1-related protein [Spatholobus suberectus]|nr:WAT1-related protein [Spatholobus suberectus]